MNFARMNAFVIFSSFLTNINLICKHRLLSIDGGVIDILWHLMWRNFFGKQKVNISIKVQDRVVEIQIELPTIELLWPRNMKKVKSHESQEKFSFFFLLFYIYVFSIRVGWHCCMGHMKAFRCWNCCSKRNLDPYHFSILGSNFFNFF